MFMKPLPDINEVFNLVCQQEGQCTAVGTTVEPVVFFNQSFGVEGRNRGGRNGYSSRGGRFGGGLYGNRGGRSSALCTYCGNT